LQDIADYYGENLTALAAHNGDVAGLFATGGGQMITIPGGPRRRAATVPPGVQALGASRPVPPPVPLDPTTAGYAQTFLLNDFSLLSYQIAETPYFKASPFGLPAGPTTQPAADAGSDKLRAPGLLAEGDDWQYRTSLPYSKPKFIKPPPKLNVADPPDLDKSPYLGIGRLLQVSFNWLDHFGNAIVTTLAQPTSPAGPLDEPPILTGYTHALSGRGQWPAAPAAWHMAPPGNGGAPQLELRLSFSPSRYSGLMLVTATTATTLSAVFTDPLATAPAQDVRNYTLTDGLDAIAVQ